MAWHKARFSADNTPCTVVYSSRPQVLEYRTVLAKHSSNGQGVNGCLDADGVTGKYGKTIGVGVPKKAGTK